MEVWKVFKSVCKYLAVIAFANFITEAAMSFGKPGLLWWYIVPLLVAVNTNVNINKDEKEEKEE
jgi:hypothetical protein